MTGSQHGGPASGAAVAFGIALLFGTGVFGFIRLTETARLHPPTAPAPRPGWRPPAERVPFAPDGNVTPAAHVAPVERVPDPEPVPVVPSEFPDIFPVPVTDSPEGN